MATQFRQLGSGDAAALAVQMQAWHLLEGVTLDAAMTVREAQRLLLDTLNWHAWMIESQGRAVGYLLLQFRKGAALEIPRAYVAALYLVPSYRNLGVGSLAHRFVTELSRWLQVQIYEFDTARENKHAHLFTRCAARSGLWNTSSSMQATA